MRLVVYFKRDLRPEFFGVVDDTPPRRADVREVKNRDCGRFNRGFVVENVEDISPDVIWYGDYNPVGGECRILDHLDVVPLRGGRGGAR